MNLNNFIRYFNTIIGLKSVFINQISNSNYIQNGLNGLWTYEEAFALKELYVEKNIERAKQHFYICGLIDELLINKFNSKLLNWATNHLSYALLSDNLQFINRYSRLPNSYNSRSTKIIGTLCKAMQNSINMNSELLNENIVKLYDIVKKSKDTEKMFYEKVIVFFEALLDKDKKKIERVLLEMLQPDFNKKRRSNEILSEMISFPEVGFAKIAWLNGIEISINNPLVPFEILPIKPNKEYKIPYDFLKEVID